MTNKQEVSIEVRKMTIYRYRGGWAATIVDMQGRTLQRVELQPSELLEIMRPLLRH